MQLENFIGLNFLDCHAKFRGNTISQTRENGVSSFGFYFLDSNFPEISELKLSIPLEVDVTSIWATSCRVTALLFFCNRKTKASRCLLAAPSANHNECNSDELLQYLIFLRPFLDMLDRIEFMIRTMCAFRILNPHLWSKAIHSIKVKSGVKKECASPAIPTTHACNTTNTLKYILRYK